MKYNNIEHIIWSTNHKVHSILLDIIHNKVNFDLTSEIYFELNNMKNFKPITQIRLTFKNEI